MGVPRAAVTCLVSVTCLNSGLHQDCGGVVDALGPELYDGGVALLLGLCDAVINVILPAGEPRVNELTVQDG